MFKIDGWMEMRAHAWVNTVALELGRRQDLGPSEQGSHLERTQVGPLELQSAKAD